MTAAMQAGMLPPLTDDEVLAAIDTVRAKRGACTYAGLARELVMSRTAVRYRIQRLIESGLVEVVAGEPGTIRRAVTETRRALSPVTGTVTLQITFDPSSRVPLEIEVIDSDGAVKRPRRRGS